MNICYKTLTVTMPVAEWYDQYDRNMEVRRCLHHRLAQAKAEAGKWTHMLAGGAIALLIGSALRGCA